LPRVTTVGDVLKYVQFAVFIAVAVIAAKRWVQRRGAARAWLAATFGLLTVVIAAGEVLERMGAENDYLVVSKALIVVLLFFPYFLYRFMATFERPPRWLEQSANAAMALVVVVTLALPRFPEPEEPRTTVFTLYVVLILVHWSFLSAVVSVRFWQAGRGQPTVARRRMRVLASGSAALAVGLIVAGAAPTAPGEVTGTTIVVQVVGILSAVLFLGGFAPPRIVLRTWRARDIEALQEALVELAKASTPEEVVGDLLPRIVQLVGAQAAAIYSDGGELLGQTGPVGEVRGEALELAPGITQLGQDHLSLALPGGRLELWTSAYTPYFGRDELDLLRTVGGLVHVTLERTYAHAREVAARDALAEAQRIAHVGSWTWDIATGRIEASDEMYRLYGLEPQCMPLTLEYLQARIHPDDRATSDRLTEQAMLVEEEAQSEFRIVTADGAVRWLHSRGRAVLGPDGTVTARIGTCQDVTEARKLDRMRSEFVANAAHELRTPLTTVSGMATLLASQRGRLSDAELDNAFDALGRQGQRARQLVTSLLDLSRLESGKVPLQVQPVSVLSAIDQALETAPAPVSARVSVDCATDVYASSDPQRLQEILVNLLTNAYRYGGPSITVAVRNAPDGVAVSVADDGNGVPPEFVSEMYQPFSRSGSVTGTPGSGLGLAISQRLAAALGGSLDYEPNQPQGAKFTVTLRPAS
jgi:PAS domain S-box-containing protein